MAKTKTSVQQEYDPRLLTPPELVSAINACFDTVSTPTGKEETEEEREERESIKTAGRLIAGVPVCVWGPPGGGKSDIIHAVAASRGWTLENKQVVDLRLSLCESVDLRGFPQVTKDETGRTVTMYAPPLELPQDPDWEGLIFLDEMNRAPTLVQNAALQLVRDRRIAMYELPKRARIIAACNRESDGGGVQKMTDALSNRFVHLEYTNTPGEWYKWALRNGIHPMVIAFLKFAPQNFHNYERYKKACASPRTWEFVSKITYQFENPGHKMDVSQRKIALHLVSGAVGDGAATEYMAFWEQAQDLPTIEEIFMNPGKARVPSEPSAKHAICVAIACHMSDNNLERAITYLNRFPEEYNVAAMKDAVFRKQELASTNPFIKWASDHQDVIL